MPKNYQRFPSLPEALDHAKSLGATHCTVLAPFRGRPTCLVYQRCPDGFRQWQCARLENVGHIDGTSYWAVSRAWIDTTKGPIIDGADPITEAIADIRATEAEKAMAALSIV